MEIYPTASGLACFNYKLDRKKARLVGGRAVGLGVLRDTLGPSTLDEVDRAEVE